MRQITFEDKVPGMNQTRKFIVPGYVKDFKCIGAACEDSCCIGWNVDIDQHTYMKYKKMRDAELTPIIEKHLKRNRAASSEAQYGKIKLNKLNDDFRCPFLDERKLCKIQICKGEKYLSSVCTSYPRIINDVNSVFERSATVSCPEAARLALLNPRGIEFVEDEEPIGTRHFLRARIDTNDRKFANKPEKYLWDLRIFTINALQNRSYKLWERLIIIGMFCKKIEECVTENKTDEIPGVIGLFTDCINDRSFSEGLSGIPTQNTIQMELLKQIADTRYVMGINSARYIECFNDFLVGIQYTEDSRIEDIGTRYSEAYARYVEGFIREHEYIFENYLVNFAFKNIFPLSDGKTVFDSYMVLVLHYALIKMHLIGMSIPHEGLTVELTLKLIQSFAKEVEHNQQYISVIIELMKQNNYNTMAYMAIFIKN